MKHEDLEAIEGVIHAVLDKRRGEDLDHKAHHAFVEAMIRREERKKEIWDKVKAHVLGWGIVALVGGLGTWILSQFGK